MGGRPTWVNLFKKRGWGEVKESLGVPPYGICLVATIYSCIGLLLSAIVRAAGCWNEKTARVGHRATALGSADTSYRVGANPTPANSPNAPSDGRGIPRKFRLETPLASCYCATDEDGHGRKPHSVFSGVLPWRKGRGRNVRLAQDEQSDHRPYSLVQPGDFRAHKAVVVFPPYQKNSPLNFPSFSATERTMEILVGEIIEVDSLRELPDTFECGEKAMGAVFGQVKRVTPTQSSGILYFYEQVFLGMKIVSSPTIPENEIHVVSYHTEGGQNVRKVHKIFQLEV